MRDFMRLREQLRLALCCGPLALGACGPSTTPTTETPPSNEVPDDPQPPPVAEVAWPEANQGCGTWGQWCGPVPQASTAAAQSQQPAGPGCPQAFSHADLYFNLDDEAMQRERAKGGDGGTCCYTYNDGCVIGRPLLQDGRATVATVRAGGAWPRHAVAAPVGELPAALRAALAAGWLDDALLEHASVASFARATLELMQLGAPPDLLADCARAGLDEVRHAEGCFGLAERYAGRRVSPGPIAAPASRPADLTRLAVDTFVEGCVAETVATLAATRVLASCRDPEVARLLDRIIRDETRHAALAWRTVAWAVAEGGAPVAAALHARASAMAPGPDGPAGDHRADPVLLAHGRLDGQTRRDAVVDAWREIIAPTLAEITAAVLPPRSGVAPRSRGA